MSTKSLESMSITISKTDNKNSVAISLKNLRLGLVSFLIRGLARQELTEYLEHDISGCLATKVRGKAAKEIDIVSKGHKFSVVFPSIHPEEGLGTYWWFPPGTPLTLEGREAWQPHMALPDARQLPILDEVWWMELSD